MIIKHGRHIFLEIHEVRKGTWAFFSLDCDADYHRGVRANHINQINLFTYFCLHYVVVVILLLLILKLDNLSFVSA